MLKKVLAVVLIACLGVTFTAYADDDEIVAGVPCSRWLKVSCEQWDRLHTYDVTKGARCFSNPQDATEALQYFRDFNPSDSRPQAIVTECVPGKHKKSGGKDENKCKSPPSFKVKTEVEGEPVPYCMVHVSSDSPYPLSCRITNAGYNMMIYPGQSKFYGWPMGGNDQCYGNVDCKRPIDYSTNKPVKYGECQ